MAGNKYQHYLNDDRASSRSSRLEDNKKGSPLLTTAAVVGGVIGAGLLYRSGALDAPLGAIGKGLNKVVSASHPGASRLGAFLSAVGQTGREEGVLSTLGGGADKAFSKNLRANLERANTRLTKPLGENIEIDDLMRKAGHVKGESLSSYIEGQRLDRIEKAYGTAIGKDSELFKDVTSILRNDTNDRGFIDRVNSGTLQELFKHNELNKKYSDDQLKNAADSLEEVLQKYRGKPSGWEDPLSNAELRAKAKEIGGVVDKAFLERLQPKKGGLASHMGMRQATVEDALKHPEWFQTVLENGDKQFLMSQYAMFPGKKGMSPKFQPRDVYGQLERLVKENPEAAKLTLGKAVMMDIKSGNLVDYRYVSSGLWKGFEAISEKVQVPLVNINPFRLIHAITIEGVHKAEPMAILRRGTKQVFLGGTDDLAEDLLYAGNKVFNIRTGQVVKDNVYLASSRYGMFRRVAENMGQLGEQKTGGWFRNTFDIGLQNRQSDFGRGAGFLTKFFNPKWEPNILYGIKQAEGEVAPETAEAAYRKIYDTLNRRVKPLDKKVMSRISPAIKNMFPGLDDSDILMETNEQVMITLGKMLKMETEAATGVYSKATGLISQMRGSGTLFSKNVDIFKMIEQAVADPEVALPGFLDALQPSMTRMVDKFTDTKRIIQQEMLSQLEAHYSNYSTLMGGLSKEQFESVGEINTLNALRRKWKAIHGLDGSTVEEATKNKMETLEDFIGSISSPTEKQQIFHDNLEKAVKKYSPWYGYGPGEKPSNAFGDTPYIVMNKIRHPIKEINEVIKAGGSFKDVMQRISDTTIGQMGFDFGFGFRAGRKNLDKVTTLTAGTYYYFDRLNEGIARMGLGLSQKSLGSAQDIFGNLVLKRYGLAVGGIMALKYLDYQAEKATGSEPSEVAGKAYVNMTRDVAKVKDVSGITDLNKMLHRMFPGSEKLFQNPLGGAIKYGTLGLIGDDRSADELNEYWANGTDAIRKGRWWGIGSNTPWYGGKIDHFAPNWYRRAVSDYKYTDVMYGSKDEYWANQWVPTPMHPLAPLHKIFDPNHWANKHREDRPYPVVGGVSELNEVPIIGPVLNGTVGQILNPMYKRGDLAKAHRQYIQDINDSIRQGEVSSPGYLYITPAGGTQTVALSGDSWGEDAAVGEMGYATVLPNGASSTQMANAQLGFAPMQSGKVLNGMDLTAINQGIISRANIGPIRGTNLEALRNKDYVESLDEVVDPSNPAYRFGESFYSISEMGGIYGFVAKTMFGDASSNKPVLARAMDMTSGTRAFWEMNLGGAGGELSEIGRRFIPRKRREEQYNPYRNKMPTWMPGPEYFLDFRHGDPYSKVMNGEYRLPGSGYESLNRLHPDMFGEYGAIDRFKILADVAPYSEQYKYYKGVMSRYNQMGWLTDREKQDVKTIKEQVMQAKQKYEFTPYKFKYAHVDEQYVHIVRNIDDTTFLTEEFPDHPIRLAGIKMPPKSDTSPEANEARAYLAANLKPGNRVKVAVDQDDLMRVRDDTMGTMRAAVFDASGQSLSARIARGKFGGAMGFGGKRIGTANWDDMSATTTYALYTKNEITLGKMWEFISHLDTPLHTKLLQNRSPLEQYKRRELYGKNWQSWDHPFRDWVKPEVNKFSQANPLVATAAGAFIGSLFVAKGSRKIGATIGGIIAGTASTVRVAKEAAGRVVNSDYTWIPKTRQRERNINEYFDMLEYMKYKGLYERARTLAIRREGVDVEKFLGNTKAGGKAVQAQRRALEQQKRWIKINMSDSGVDQEEAKAELDLINQKLAAFEGQKGLVNLGPLALQAIKYKTTYESTLYGADPNGAMVQIYRALPNKEREFFKEFMLAAPEEREEILRLVPKNERRFFQAKWGLKVDQPENINSYFAKHYLPGPSWAGWKPGVSLEAIKLKVIQNEALDMTEFGFFQGDEKFAAGAPEIKPFRPSGFIDIGKIKQVLRGAGLRYVDVKQIVSPSEAHGITVDVNMAQDRRKDIKDSINSNMSSILAI